MTNIVLGCVFLPHRIEAYNLVMRGWSLPVGRWFGVEVRIHLFFLVLLVLTVSYASALDGTGGRGLGLWFLLLLAVAVREVARVVAAAWWGLPLRGVLLTPTGGMLTFETNEATERARFYAMERRMCFVGPLANLAAGLTIAGLVLTITPAVSFVVRPLVTPAHLLRAMVWVNLLLAGIHLLPALPLDAGRVLRVELTRRHIGQAGGRIAGALGQAIAFGLMLSGLVFANIWMTMMGAFVMVGMRLEDQGTLFHADHDTVKMRDVMMTEFSTLSASDTLEDALRRSVHSLQDVFPVVRGMSMVGAVSRQGILDALQADGNGYVQGVMTKSFETAHPDDSLVKTLRRVMGGEGAQLLPVLEGERVVGIITPKNLAHSIGMLQQSRRFRLSE